MRVKHGVLYNKFCADCQPKYVRCSDLINSRCVIYKGEDLIGTDIVTGDTMEGIIKQINTIIKEYRLDYERVVIKFEEGILYINEELTRIENEIREFEQEVDDFLKSFCDTAVECIENILADPYNWKPTKNTKCSSHPRIFVEDANGQYGFREYTSHKGVTKWFRDKSKDYECQGGEPLPFKWVGDEFECQEVKALPFKWVEGNFECQEVKALPFKWVGDEFECQEIEEQTPLTYKWMRDDFECQTIK